MIIIVISYIICISWAEFCDFSYLSMVFGCVLHKGVLTLQSLGSYVSMIVRWGYIFTLMLTTVTVFYIVISKQRFYLTLLISKISLIIMYICFKKHQNVWHINKIFEKTLALFTYSIVMDIGSEATPSRKNLRRTIAICSYC